MARLFGLIGNRSDLASRVLAYEHQVLRVKAKGSPLGWGVGLYQGGEVLMRRRPLDEQDIDVVRVSSDVRADVIVGHVRSATIGALRTENTHPFRYRQWLFAQTGTLPAFQSIRDRLVESVPEFLRSGIRGETDAEVFFHIFLSFLHDRGLLNEAHVEPTVVGEALRASIAVVDATVAEVAGEKAAINALVSNGEEIVALAGGEKMAVRSFSGKSDAELIIGDDASLRRKTPELTQMRFSLVASDFDDDSPLSARNPTDHLRWKEVPRGSLVILTRGDEPHVATP